MPTQLAKHVPGNNATLTAELFASTLNIATYAKDGPIRIGGQPVCHSGAPPPVPVEY